MDGGERKIEENQGMMKEDVMKDGMKNRVFREGNSPNEVWDFGKHVGNTFREDYLKDPEFCCWTMRQQKLGAQKLKKFRYFVERMQD